MVDFNNETTIGTPAVDIERVLILQRRNDVIDALEGYKKLDYQGTEADLSIFRSRVLSFFEQLSASILRVQGQDSFLRIQLAIETGTFEEI